MSAPFCQVSGCHVNAEVCGPERGSGPLTSHGALEPQARRVRLQSQRCWSREPGGREKSRSHFYQGSLRFLALKFYTLKGKADSGSEALKRCDSWESRSPLQESCSVLRKPHVPPSEGSMFPACAFAYRPNTSDVLTPCWALRTRRGGRRTSWALGDPERERDGQGLTDMRNHGCEQR